MKTLLEAIRTEHRLLVPEQVAQECLAVTRRKIPRELDAIERFLAQSSVYLIPMRRVRTSKVDQIRDETDQPILDAAIAADVDIIISGDRDFLAVEIDNPRIMKPADFISEFLPDPN